MLMIYSPNPTESPVSFTIVEHTSDFVEDLANHIPAEGLENVLDLCPDVRLSRNN